MFGWFALGLLLPIVGVLIAYMRRPHVPVQLLVRYDDPKEAVWFERAYFWNVSLNGAERRPYGASG